MTSKVTKLDSIALTTYDYLIQDKSGKELAMIHYSPDTDWDTQPWKVCIGGKEKFSNTTYARCLNYVLWHYKNKTLVAA